MNIVFYILSILIALVIFFSLIPLFEKIGGLVEKLINKIKSIMEEN